MICFPLQTMLPVMLSHTPSGASIKQLEHFGQLMKSGHFRKFDRGYLRNQLEYNRITPPDYDLNKVKVPVALYYSVNDMLVSTTGVDRLARELPQVIDKYLVPMEKFNHLDFLWAIDVKTLVYNRLVRNIRRVENFKLKHNANLAANLQQQQQYLQQQRLELLNNQHTLPLSPLLPSLPLNRSSDGRVGVGVAADTMPTTTATTTTTLAHTRTVLQPQPQPQPQQQQQSQQQHLQPLQTLPSVMTNA